MVRICVVAGIFAMAVSASALGQSEVDAGRVSDIVLEANNGGFHAIFYDTARKVCVTSGTIIFSKKVVRLKDVPKMEGRGVNQQIIMERQTYEEYEPLLNKAFGAGDFHKVSIGVGEGRMALPVKLTGVAHGNQIKIEFGNVRKDVVVGYFGEGERR